MFEAMGRSHCFLPRDETHLHGSLELKKRSNSHLCESRLQFPFVIAVRVPTVIRGMSVQPIA